MMLLKPFKKIIRRRFLPGIWIRFRSSSHQMQLHFKIHHFQVCFYRCRCAHYILLRSLVFTRESSYRTAFSAS